MPVTGLAGLVLAAGASSRLGRSKMLEPVHGEPMIRLSCQAARTVCGAGVALVTGRNGDEVARAADGLVTSVILNRNWAHGMAESIRVGVDQLGPAVTGVLVMPGDLAEVDGEDLSRLAAAWSGQLDSPAAAEFDGVIGAPAIFPREWFPRLASLTGDQGARSLLRSAERISIVPMETAGRDVDTPEDLDRLSDRGR